jgi:hypothetical protein
MLIKKYFYFLFFIPLILSYTTHELFAESVQNIETKNSLYQIKFYSLKNNNSIGAAQFKLNEDGSLIINIEGEELSDFKGKYNIKSMLFKATAEFTIKRKINYHYALSFNGIAVFDTYLAGTAKLIEYIEGNKPTQELQFLFIASNKSESEANNRPALYAGRLGNALKGHFSRGTTVPIVAFFMDPSPKGEGFHEDN